MTNVCKVQFIKLIFIGTTLRNLCNVQLEEKTKHYTLGKISSLEEAASVLGHGAIREEK